MEEKMEFPEGCLCIGVNAGADLTDEKSVVIIGDNIRTIPKGKKLRVGKYIGGVRCNLYDILIENYPDVCEVIYDKK